MTGIDPGQLAGLTRRLEGHLLDATADDKTAQTREEKWLTAEQISAWWEDETGAGIDAPSLDRALLEYWYEHRDQRPPLRFRPAKYPNRTTTTRLWGAIGYRGSGPADLAQCFACAPVEFERVNGKATLNAFVSHATADVHLVARIRMLLADFGIKAWLAEESLFERGLLAEGIEEALGICDFVLLALSSKTLGSPWVETELDTASQRGLPVLVTIDVVDAELLNLLRNWEPAAHNKAISEFSEDDLCKMAHRNSRLKDQKKFVAARAFLSQLHNFPRSFYPSRPLSWGQAAKGFLDFPEALRHFLRDQDLR